MMLKRESYISNGNKNNENVFLLPVKKSTLEASALTSVSSGESLATFFASVTNAHHYLMKLKITQTTPNRTCCMWVESIQDFIPQR